MRASAPSTVRGLIDLRLDDLDDDDRDLLRCQRAVIQIDIAVAVAVGAVLKDSTERRGQRLVASIEHYLSGIGRDTVHENLDLDRGFCARCVLVTVAAHLGLGVKPGLQRHVDKQIFLIRCLDRIGQNRGPSQCRLVEDIDVADFGRRLGRLRQRTAGCQSQKTDREHHAHYISCFH